MVGILVMSVAKVEWWLEWWLGREDEEGYSFSAPEGHEVVARSLTSETSRRSSLSRAVTTVAS